MHSSRSVSTARWGRSVSALLILVSLVAASLSASAQQASEESVNPGSGITREQLMSVIANETVLAPGIGLRHIRLGESMREVRNRLGPPRKTVTDGLARKTTTLSYLLDSGTLVNLQGDDTVENISVSGNAAALVRTVKGARFCMNSSLIQRIYREPSRRRDDRLEYRHLGVTFFFKNDQVVRIWLYPKRG